MEIFDSYTSNYDMELPAIKRKYYHSYRVQNVACEIAESLNYNERDYNLVSICGLFHDIARFEQYKRYHSFKDSETIDHGDFGYEILKDEFLDKLGLDDEENNILLMSTKYHNKYAVDKGITGKALEICNITRDADRIDILSLFFDPNIQKSLTDENMNVTNKCHEEFISHRQIMHKDIKTDGDRILLYLGFIWDFNFKKSYEIINRTGIYEKIKENIKLPSFDKYFQMIEEKIKEEIK